MQTVSKLQRRCGCGESSVTVSPYRRIYLQFEAVGSAFYCWLNGSKVGYAQDTFLSSEFDVTDLVKPGSNHLAVQVNHFATL